MNCQKCNSPLQPGATVCSKCGAAVNLTQTQAAQANKKKKLLSLAVAAVVLIAIVAIGSSRGNKDRVGPVSNNSVQNMVAQAKAKAGLPKKIDANTTLVDLTAEGNAVRYHYTITGVPPLPDANAAKVGSEGMKTTLLPNICANPETKSILDQGIGLEYAYDFQNSEYDMFVAFTKADCAK